MEIMENKLITSFLNQPDNQELYNKYQANRINEVKDILDARFRIFYQRYRVISYLIKVLHFESKHFDKKLRIHDKRYQLSTKEDEVEQIINEQTFKSGEHTTCDNSLNIQDHLTDEDLFHRISVLSDRQKNILTLIYVQQMTDTEAAKYLGVTQQSISKTRNNVIKKLRDGGKG